MAVFLSPVGGAAVQFFDNSGQVLTGGLLYTYLAGTTTPAATYTSNTGTQFHTNPIILDASGRIPNGGEVWLAQNIQYKFVLKDANSVLIGTWDNIIGINSNFLNYNVQEETQTATQGQTVFTLATISYTPGTNTLSVYVNGSKQIPDINYVETDSTTVTFLTGLNVGDVVDFTTAVSLSSGVTSADLVTYNEGQAGAITRSVTSRLQDYISVKDFGAVGDGATDDTAAFQSALDAVSNGGTINIPPGIYALTHVNFNKRGVTLQGESLGAVGLTNGVQLKCTAAISDFFVVQTYDSQIINMYINGNGLAGNVVRYKEGTTDITMRKVTVYGAATDGANVNLTPTVQYPIGPGPWNIETSSFEDCFFNGDHFPKPGNRGP